MVQKTLDFAAFLKALKAMDPEQRAWLTATLEAMDFKSILGEGTKGVVNKLLRRGGKSSAADALAENVEKRARQLLVSGKAEDPFILSQALSNRLRIQEPLGPAWYARVVQEAALGYGLPTGGVPPEVLASQVVNKVLDELLERVEGQLQTLSPEEKDELAKELDESLAQLPDEEKKTLAMILREAGVESLTGRSLLAALGGGLAAHVLRLFALELYRAALRTVAARNVLFVLARFLGVQAGLRLMLAPLVILLNPWVAGGITLAGGWKAVQGEVRKLDRRLAALTLTQVLLATDTNEEEPKEAE
ncbi:hypothetical protein TthHB5008_b22670 (plasmid) [Thermus thermophilus]|nr:hypothetical protein TthHB5002_b22980 [Thermus thermophilus]BCQ01497.1 hypothetical protein TthHB5008_b22670 [Thermus thermophilus]